MIVHERLVFIGGILHCRLCRMEIATSSRVLFCVWYLEEVGLYFSNSSTSPGIRHTKRLLTITSATSGIYTRPASISANSGEIPTTSRKTIEAARQPAVSPIAVGNFRQISCAAVPRSAGITCRLNWRLSARSELARVVTLFAYPARVHG